MRQVLHQIPPSLLAVALLALGAVAVLRATPFRDDGTERTITYVTGAHAVQAREIVLVNGAVGDQTLPDLSNQGGVDVSLRNVGSTAARVVGFSAGDVIDGAADLVLAPGASVTLFADPPDLPGQWFSVR